MSTHVPARAPLADTTPVAAHNRTRWLLIGTVIALAIFAAGAIIALRGHTMTGTLGDATVAAAPTTDVIATLPPGVPTPTPLATVPPTAVPTQPPPTVTPPTAAPVLAPTQPLAAAPAPKAPPATGPGNGKGKGKDDGGKHGDD
jgi:hypothetical protein